MAIETLKLICTTQNLHNSVNYNILLAIINDVYETNCVGSNYEGEIAIVRRAKLDFCVECMKVLKNNIYAFNK